MSENEPQHRRAPRSRTVERGGTVGASPGQVRNVGSDSYAALTRVPYMQAGMPRFITPKLPVGGGTLTLEEYRQWEAEVFSEN